MLTPKGKAYDLGASVTRLFESVSKVSIQKLYDQTLLKKISLTGGKAHNFLGASSAKVIKSMGAGKIQDEKWINAVMYLSPADRAIVPFLKIFGMDMAKKLIGNLNKLSRENPFWTKFKTPSLTKLQSVGTHIRTLQKGKVDPGYKPVRTSNLINGLTLCPHASPNCRALCLNESGQAGVIQKTIKQSGMSAVNATRLQNGITFEDDLKYLYIRDVKTPFDFGEVNTIQAARVRRTLLMWYTWATQGIIENMFNDILYLEALNAIDYANKKGLKVAFRFNGTSDIPFHTLKLSGAVCETRALRGKYLIDEIGNLGGICYDYTKDFTLMKNWVTQSPWKNTQDALSKSVVRKKGFPSNYYLCFSWSEINAKLALKILRLGGNIVMVFRPSIQDFDLETVKKKGTPYHPARTDIRIKGKLRVDRTFTMKVQKGSFPTKIHVGQLSLDKEDKKWIIDIIPGDETDLRFADPTSRKANGGRVVGLTPKGDKVGLYTDKERKKVYRHFTNPVTLKKIGSEIYAFIRINPNLKNDGIGKNPGIVEVDADIYKQASSIIDGFEITTTAMGT